LTDAQTAKTPDATPGDTATPPPGGMAYARSSLALFAVLLVVDQVTKVLAKAHLEPQPFEAIPFVTIIPGFFKLQYAENLGAAFSILEGRGGLLIGISVLSTVLLLWWWRQLAAGERIGRLAVAAILSGAIGNMIDRIFRGYVVDFFYAYYDRWHWPVFNVADTAICVGVGFLMLRIVQGKV
jgi:signal peptidase II